jgi:ribosomal protein L40E
MISLKNSIFDKYIIWHIRDFLDGTPRDNYSKVINELSAMKYYNLLDILETDFCTECEMTTHSFMGFCRECFSSEIREILKEQDNLEYKICQLCEDLELHDSESCIYCEPYNIMIDTRKLY